MSSLPFKAKPVAGVVCFNLLLFLSTHSNKPSPKNAHLKVNNDFSVTKSDGVCTPSFAFDRIDHCFHLHILLFLVPIPSQFF